VNACVKSARWALWVLIAAPLHAHHSAAMFDEKQCVRLTGSVTRITMTYPHVWVWMDVKDKGGTVNWALESTDPSSQRVQGWAPGTVKAGTRLDMVVSPIRDGRKIAIIRATRLPDGRVMTSGGPKRCPLPWPDGKNQRNTQP
jgi:hypothetical protein